MNALRGVFCLNGTRESVVPFSLERILIMKKFEEIKEFGHAARLSILITDVLSTNFMPKLRKGQVGWKPVKFEEAAYPASVLKVARQNGYTTLLRI